jgi:hypothetical protein
MDGGCTNEEYDTQRGDEFCVRTYCTQVWDTTDLTTEQGASFLLHEFKEFVESLKIKLLNSSPYYAQANRHVESNNKNLRWHVLLSEAL